MEGGKLKIAYKGEFKSLVYYFDSTFKGEDFETAFLNRKRLTIGKYIWSYDYLYKLYRSPDGKYILIERYFE